MGTVSFIITMAVRETLIDVVAALTTNFKNVASMSQLKLKVNNCVAWALNKIEIIYLKFRFLYASAFLLY